MAQRTLSCPGCQTLMTVAPGMTRFSCPKCKKELALPGAPPTVPPPPAPEVTVAKRAKLKASVIDEKKEAEEAEARARKAELKRELAKIREEEAEYREEFEDYKIYTRRARMGLMNAYWGIRLYMLAIVLSLVVGVSLVFVSGVATPLTALLSVVSATSLILITVSFGYALAGPPTARMYGYIGLPVCIVHTIIVLFQALIGFGFAALMGLGEADGKENAIVTRGIAEATGAYYAFGLGTNFFAVSDSASRLVQGWGVPWLPIFAAMFEFTRMALVVLMVQLFAELGKAPEMGYRAFRSINVFFWTVLLITVARTTVTPIFADAEPGAMSRIIGNSLHGGIFIIGILCYGLTLMSLANSIDDIKSICTAERYLSKSASME